MTLYKIFIICFILSVISLLIFLYYYFNFFIGMMDMISMNKPDEVNPGEIMRLLFTPQIIISGIVMALSWLTYKILGIVFIANNPQLDSSEKILWILGFIFFSFVTAIIFMALKNSKNLLARKQAAIVGSIS